MCTSSQSPGSLCSYVPFRRAGAAAASAPPNADHRGSGADVAVAPLQGVLPSRPAIGASGVNPGELERLALEIDRNPVARFVLLYTIFGAPGCGEQQSARAREPAPVLFARLARDHRHLRFFDFGGGGGSKHCVLPGATEPSIDDGEDGASCATSCPGTRPRTCSTIWDTDEQPASVRREPRRRWRWSEV